MNLSELVARVSALTGPLTVIETHSILNESVDEWADDEVGMLFAALLGGRDAVGAALSLVERRLPGWDWDVANSRNPTRAHEKYRAELYRPSDPPAWEVGLMPTPALALLLACLRALENGVDA